MWSTFELLPDPPSPAVLVPVRVPTMRKIELFNHLPYWKPFNCGKKNYYFLIAILETI